MPAYGGIVYNVWITSDIVAGDGERERSHSSQHLPHSAHSTFRGRVDLECRVVSTAAAAALALRARVTVRACSCGIFLPQRSIPSPVLCDNDNRVLAAYWVGENCASVLSTNVHHPLLLVINALLTIPQLYHIPSMYAFSCWFNERYRHRGYGTTIPSPGHTSCT